MDEFLRARLAGCSIVGGLVEEGDVVGLQRLQSLLILLRRSYTGIRGAARVPCEPVQTIDQLLTDPQVQAREMVQQVDFPGLGEIPIPGFPVKMSLTPGSIRSHAPGLGEHNEYVYKEILNFNSEKLTALKEEGVI